MAFEALSTALGVPVLRTLGQASYFSVELEENGEAHADLTVVMDRHNVPLGFR